MGDRETVFRQSLMAVFEAMFFESLEDEPFETADVPGSALYAQVDFTGSHGGRMQVALESQTAATLAGNFLGLSGDEGRGMEEQVLEKSTLGELANICCGSFLSRFDPRGSFSIQPPEVFVCAPDGDVSPWLAMPMGGGTAYFRLKWRDAP
jgi:chemotaxis protein CheY-P-specific phosphatase CheC